MLIINFYWLARRTCYPDVLGLILAALYMPGAHQACYPYGVGKLVSVSAGVERSPPLIQPYGFDQYSDRVWLVLFHNYKPSEPVLHSAEHKNNHMRPLFRNPRNQGQAVAQEPINASWSDWGGGSLAVRLGRDMKKYGKTRFRKIGGKTDTKDMWEEVRKLTGKHHDKAAGSAS